MTAPVLVTRHDGWHAIMLNRPDKLNAVNAEMLNALSMALDSAGKDRSCRALLLTGAGRGFCSGQELGAAIMSGTDDSPNLAPLADAWHRRLIGPLRTLALPVVCAVNGVAAGAGANLALACDIVLAANSASFVQAFVRIGLMPDCGGTFFLPRLIGEARARALAMLGEPVSATQAESWGMIWKAVEDEQLMAQAEALTRRLAVGPTEALALMKRAFAASSCNGLEAQLELEKELQRAAGATADFAAGVQAFLARRAPVFTGGR